jgi:hypothetical protein
VAPGAYPEPERTTFVPTGPEGGVRLTLGIVTVNGVPTIQLAPAVCEITTKPFEPAGTSIVGEELIVPVPEDVNDADPAEHGEIPLEAKQ